MKRSVVRLGQLIFAALLFVSSSVATMGQEWQNLSLFSDFPSQAWVITNGEVVAVVDHYGVSSGGRVAVVDDSPGQPIVYRYPDIGSPIWDATIIDDSLWILTDSVYVVDLTTYVMSSLGVEPFGGYVDGLRHVSQIGGRVAVYGSNGLFVRDADTHSWDRIGTSATLGGRECFLGQDTSFFTVSAVGFDFDRQHLYVHHIDLKGQQLGEPVWLIDTFVQSRGMRGLEVCGKYWLYKEGNRLNRYSTDPDAGWFSRDELIYHTNAGSFFWAHDDTTAGWVTEFGEQYTLLPIPNLSTYSVKEFFCLDNNCYANTTVGLLSAPRSTTFVGHHPIEGRNVDVTMGVLRLQTLSHVQVTDLAGRSLYDGRLAPGNYELSSFPAGVILISVSTASDVQRRVIVNINP